MVLLVVPPSSCSFPPTLYQSYLWTLEYSRGDSGYCSGRIIKDTSVATLGARSFSVHWWNKCYKHLFSVL